MEKGLGFGYAAPFFLYRLLRFRVLLLHAFASEFLATATGTSVNSLFSKVMWATVYEVLISLISLWMFYAFVRFSYF